ncbi:uncharacterized protein LOC124631357 [Helicoverpa zea]|uniref:uncharacterized protein LOC124631357 n=1 Tax=Helicoverpa zea TaxID=7113 RepID=UPI001F5A1F3B|nr:uncharacterized protein LOC124631357 [Helicoverpa zea]
MVNTPGCHIPIAMVDYEKHVSNTTNNKNEMCGKRAVFIRKYDKDKVIARIKSAVLKKYSKLKIHSVHTQCCYKFIIDTVYYVRPILVYSNCTDFRDEEIITLKSDFINVMCYELDINGTSHVIYEDVYAFTKKIEYSKPNEKNCRIKFNVLILGMDAMSLPRVVKTMPRTIAYLKDDNWLGFRGYHKIGDNSLPNILALLTGKNMTSIIEQCFASMDDCNYLLIWSAFKDAGYVTAYGEENLKLANTFTKEYKFLKNPTDHYMQPFYLTDERNPRNRSLCTGKISSGQQLLDYARDFASTYRRDSFFGFFWLNSFSYDEKSRPEDADKLIENFLNQLTYTGIMTNTFVIFLSDHGLRFGRSRLKAESYYDDRMPMNFMWVPLLFKGKHPYELRAMAINQYKLATPYDFYSTLQDIKKISLCSNSTDPAPEGCPNCHSLFEVIDSNRTCQDAAINEKWCSCHKLFPLPIQDPIGIKSVNAVVSYMKSMAMTIETQKCWSCALPSLKKVERINFYYDEGKVNIYYVVALTISPGNGTYEATVLRKNGYTVIGPLSFISYYRGLGKCALNRRDRLFCVCQEQQC